MTTVKRERVKEEEYEIPQNVLDAMMSDIAASERVIKARQDSRPAGEGQTTIRGIVKGYRGKVVDAAGVSRNAQVATPPDQKMIRGVKDPSKQFPEPIIVYVQVLEMDAVPNVIEPLEDGSGWKIRAKLVFKPEAKKWMEEYFFDFYDDKFKTRVPVDTYISPEGEMATHKWINIQHKSTVQIKVSDTEGNIFRKKNEHGSFEVSPLTRITFSGCIPEQYVGMRDDNDHTDTENAEDGAGVAEGAPAAVAAAGKKKVQVPQGYTSFVSKGSPILADDHDSDMPPTERLHASINLDVHNLIPIEDLRAGKPVPMTVDFYASARYHSKMGTENGVSIFKMKVDELSDFYRVYDKKERASYTIRLNVFQWHKEANLSDKYSVKIVPTKDQADLWRAMGITDPKTYGYIAHANTDIACWVEAILWKSAVIKADANKPDQIHNNPVLANVRCHYTFGFKSIMFDFLRYFPARGLQISNPRVLAEFDAWTGTSKRNNETTMILKVTRDPQLSNPLHYADLMSPVLSLGNNAVENPEAKVLKPLNHGYTGDVWPIMGDCDFYVLTSHVLTIDERLMYCGDGASTPLEEHDKFLNKLIADEHVLYWIYAVRRDAIDRYSGTKPAAAAVAPPKEHVAAQAAAEAGASSAVVVSSTKKTKAEEEEEESGPIEMEREDEPEPVPTPKRKTAAKTAAKITTKKK